MCGQYIFENVTAKWKKEVNMIKVKSLYELWYNIYFVLDIGSWIISRQKVHFSSPVSHTKNIVRYDTQHSAQKCAKNSWKQLF